ncbi:MAG: flavodoxin family protein [Chloroflexi bacterium]|nr:flavodoxin family protein [Chloroflexota bacterium]
MAKTTLIIYHTIRAGNTKRMAEAIAEGASAEGVEAIVKSVKDVTWDEVVAADGIALGTPQPFSMLSGPMKTFFEDNWADHERITGKPAVCFIKSSRDPSAGIAAIDKIVGYYGVKKVADTVGATEVTDAVIGACRAAGKALALEVKQLQTV